jgi:hypothetical protein
MAPLPPPYFPTILSKGKNNAKALGTCAQDGIIYIANE